MQRALLTRYGIASEHDDEADAVGVALGGYIKRRDQQRQAAREAERPKLPGLEGYKPRKRGKRKASAQVNGLDVCAGSGIGSAAFEAIGFCRTVCYIERDPYCQRLIEQRMRDGWLQPAPIWDDIKTFDGRPWRGLVDFVFGGIPCQPHSLAGKRAGRSDERDLWLDFWRIVREVGPSIVLLENVPGMLSSDRGAMFGRILGDLASGGYDAEWDCIPAAAVGAPHQRDRVWVVAYSSRPGRQQDAGSTHGDEGQDEGRTASDLHEPTGDGEGLCARIMAHTQRSGWDGWTRELGQAGRTEPADCGGAVADTEGNGRSEGRTEPAWQQGRPDAPERRASLADAAGARLAQRQGIADDAGQQQQAAERGGDGAGPGRWWSVEPDVDRVAHGVAQRVDRLRTIGNGWVPQVAAVVAGRIARAIDAENRPSDL